MPQTRSVTPIMLQNRSRAPTGATGTVSTTAPGCPRGMAVSVSVPLTASISSLSFELALPCHFNFNNIISMPSKQCLCVNGSVPDWLCDLRQLHFWSYDLPIASHFLCLNKMDAISLSWVQWGLVKIFTWSAKEQEPSTLSLLQTHLKNTTKSLYVFI